MKKVVVIGGGNGGAVSIGAIKQFKDEVELAAVISMSDSGGSSGRLRKEFKTLPPGDIMRAILAMSPYDYKVLKKIFHKNRFSKAGKLDNHDLGNMFLVLGEHYTGDYMASVRALEQAVEAVGPVYPVTKDKTDLVVELENGEVVQGEDEIDRPKDKQSRIKKAWLEPTGDIYQEAEKAITEADYIIIGPGSLYCSVVATLLPKGVKIAIEQSKATLIGIVGNAYEQDGEAGPTKVSECIKEVEGYLPHQFDYIVYNDCKLSKQEKTYYQQRQWALYEFDKDNLSGYEIVQGDFEREGGGLNAEKLSQLLKPIILK